LNLLQSASDVPISVANSPQNLLDSYFAKQLTKWNAVATFNKWQTWICYWGSLHSSMAFWVAWWMCVDVSK